MKNKYRVLVFAACILLSSTHITCQRIDTTITQFRGFIKFETAVKTESKESSDELTLKLDQNEKNAILEYKFDTNGSISTISTSNEIINYTSYCDSTESYMSQAGGDTTSEYILLSTDESTYTRTGVTAKIKGYITEQYIGVIDSDQSSNHEIWVVINFPYRFALTDCHNLLHENKLILKSTLNFNGDHISVSITQELVDYKYVKDASLEKIKF